MANIRTRAQLADQAQADQAQGISEADRRSLYITYGPDLVWFAEYRGNDAQVLTTLRSCPYDTNPVTRTGEPKIEDRTPCGVRIRFVTGTDASMDAARRIALLTGLQITPIAPLEYPEI